MEQLNGRVFRDRNLVVDQARSQAGGGGGGGRPPGRGPGTIAAALAGAAGERFRR